MSDLDPPTSGDSDRFVVGRQLGFGGMGAVFFATDTRFDRVVALKVMSDRIADASEFRARFRREADVLARLDSPHVTAIYDHGEDDGTLWIATQLVRGGDLGTLLHEQGPLTPRRAVQLCAQVAEALRAAHAVGVLHRDVKPSNVLLRDPEAEPLHAYLCDFGIADTGTERLTVAGGVPGTWSYLAPERAQGSPAAPTTDVYAVGCLLWACLAGQPPYTGSDVDVAIGHLERPVPQVPENAPGLADLNLVLRRALAKSPAERFQDAEELRDALSQVGRALPALPPLDLDRAASEPRSPRGHRGRLVAIAGVTVALVAAGIVAAVLRDTGPETGPAVSTGAGSTPRPVTSDFTGDGLGDLVVHEWGSGKRRVKVLAGDGSTFGTPRTLSTLDFEVLRGDVDGDGTEELVSVESGPDPADGSPDAPDSPDASVSVTVTPYPSEGAESETHPLTSSLDPAPVFVGVAVLADVTGDGRDDLVVANRSFTSRNESVIWLAASNGRGFQELEEVYASPEPVQRVVAADVEGDGDDDLVVSNYDGELAILESDTDTQSLVPHDHERVNTSTDGVFSADVDGDGADELVTVDAIGSANTIVVIQRSGDAWDAEVWLADEAADHQLGEGSLRTGVTDVNGDGRDDLVRFSDARARRPREVKVFISSGSDFAAPVQWGTYTCACKEYFDPVGPTLKN